MDREFQIKRDFFPCPITSSRESRIVPAARRKIRPLFTENKKLSFMETRAYQGPVPSILVVDDDEVVRLLLHQFLEGAGYQVTEAEDGRQALDILARQSFDLVIMDISMPGIDGPEVCEQIRTTMVNDILM